MAPMYQVAHETEHMSHYSKLRISIQGNLPLFKKKKNYKEGNFLEYQSHILVKIHGKIYLLVNSTRIFHRNLEAGLDITVMLHFLA